MPPRRGRPPLPWLTTRQVFVLPMGTAVILETTNHRGIVRGRIAGVVGNDIVLADGRRFTDDRIKRGRVVTGIFANGELVLRRGVPESDWRGGVVRTTGLEVLVESTDGTERIPEWELEAAESRSPSNARARAREEAE